MADFVADALRAGLGEVHATPWHTCGQVSRAIRRCFAGGLCHPVDDLNPLSRLSQTRRLTLLGPGRDRDRVGTAARDLHPSQYGYICPVETAEGAGFGLGVSLALYAAVDGSGFLQTAYKRVRDDVPVMLRGDEAEGRVVESAGGELRCGLRPTEGPAEFTEVAAEQCLGVAAALVPFLAHDDAVRVTMGANMQRQAVPLLHPEPPLVGTGMEDAVARDGGLCVIASEIRQGQLRRRQSRCGRWPRAMRTVFGDLLVSGGITYHLRGFEPSSRGGCLRQRPRVRRGDEVQPDVVLADGPASFEGRLALGRNVLTAFMTWEGYNFEDGIVVSEALVHRGAFTSLHIEQFTLDIRHTPDGEEKLTSRVPTIGTDRLRHLREDGVAAEGTRVRPGDVLVGRVSPRRPGRMLTGKERLIKDVHGKEVLRFRDTSLRVPAGVEGIVCSAHVDQAGGTAALPEGVLRRVTVCVAVCRTLEVGDKMAGRHGNKGVVTAVVPVEDMPHLKDGTPVEMILNPLGVPGRMNLGQLFEAELGWAMRTLGHRAVTPALSGATEAEVCRLLRQARSEPGRQDGYRALPRGIGGAVRRSNRGTVRSTRYGWGDVYDEA